MALPFDQAMCCPIIVGRVPQLAALDVHLDMACAGRGHAVLLAGDAGIGKSRLVAEARARAAARGMAILEGRCFEPDRALPYAPLLDLLRARLAAQPAGEPADVLGPAAGDLVTLLPELAGALPARAPSAALEPEQEKRRLFHAVTRLLPDTGAQPALVILEDLHWSDDTGLEFLLYLARRIGPRPIALVLTYRTDEPHPGLRHFLAELDRGRLATELQLTRLTEAEVHAMLQAIFALGRPIHAGFRDALYALTEGNPFFIEEILTSLFAAGDLPGSEDAWDRTPLDARRIPRTVQDAVWRRLVRVSAPAQRVLTLAAVAGRRFDFSLLQDLAGLGEATLLRLLKELVAAQLVVEESTERFAFRHALTRQAIYAQLLARERQALHRALVQTMERLAAEPPDAYLPDLAYHAYEGGIWERALRYARRMGERAQAMDAPQAAIEHFTHALEAAQRLGQSPSPDISRERARAYEVHGDFERAREDYEHALEAVRASGDSGAEWQGLLDLGFLWLARDFERAGDLFRRALELAGLIGDRARLAHSLNRLGNWYANMEQPRQGEDLHRQALAIFTDLDDRQGIADTLDLLAVATHIRGSRRGAIAHFEEAAALFRALHDRRGLASTLATVAHMRCPSWVYDTEPGVTASPGQALRESEEALTIARAIGWRGGEAYCLSEWSVCLATAGDYGRALAAGQESLAVAEEIGHREWLAVAHDSLGFIYLDLLAPGPARLHCERAYAYALGSGSRHMIDLSAAFLAWAHLLGEEPAGAAAALADRVVLESPVETLTQAVALAAYADLSLASGDPGTALRVADRLIAWTGQASGGEVVPRLWTLRGEALALLGQAAEAEAELRAAWEAAHAQGAGPLLRRILLALALLLAAQGRRDEAQQAYAAVRALVDQIAATIPDDTVREEFRHHALARVPLPRPATPRRAAKERHGGLTTREREVAVLIARGQSNREIAGALVVSERTVEAHTGHIRDKLGCTSRAQVAAWAIEGGLASDLG